MEAIRNDMAASRQGRGGVLLIAVIALLALTLLGPAMTIIGAGTMTGEGSPVRQGGYLIIFAMIFYGINPFKSRDRVLAVPLPLVIALAWCWLSVLWAIDPGVAIRRVVLTSVIMWSIFAGVKRLGYERTVLLVRIALVIALFANYVAVIAFPEFGIHQFDDYYDKALVGDWRGIMAQKNLAGAVCALTVLMFVFDARRIPKFVRIGVLAASALFMFKCESRTSAGLCVMALALGLIYVRYNARYRLLVLGGVFTLAILLGIYLNIYNDPLLRHLNDPTAFTGRTQIWQALSKYSADHLMLGSGYGSFWNIGELSPIYQYGKDWVLKVAQGHNGFLDLLVQIGLPGLILVVGAAVVWPLVRLFTSRSAQGSRGALIVSVFLFCVAHNGTETSLFDRDAICEVFLMIAIALLWSITGTTEGMPRPPRSGAEPARPMRFREAATARR